jgi:hypothetical protein
VPYGSGMLDDRGEMTTEIEAAALKVAYSIPPHDLQRAHAAARAAADESMRARAAGPTAAPEVLHVASLAEQRWALIAAIEARMRLTPPPRPGTLSPTYKILFTIIMAIFVATVGIFCHAFSSFGR